MYSRIMYLCNKSINVYWFQHDCRNKKFNCGWIFCNATMSISMYRCRLCGMRYFGFITIALHASSFSSHCELRCCWYISVKYLFVAFKLFQEISFGFHHIQHRKCLHFRNVRSIGMVQWNAKNRKSSEFG